MSQKVVKSIDSRKGGLGNNVKEVNATYTEVADSLDISSAKNELNGTINDVKNKVISRVEALTKRVDILSNIPGEINEMIEQTNKQQVDLLQNMFEENSTNLSKQQKLIEKSCVEIQRRINQLKLELEHADINKKIQKYSNELCSMKGKVKWLFGLFAFCIILCIISIITFLSK